MTNPPTVLRNAHDITEVRVSNFDDGVADALIDIHDTVSAAVESAVAHTLIDDAGREAFVEWQDVDASIFRDAVRDLNDAGYAFDSDGCAFYAGAYAVDAARDALPGRYHIEDDVVLHEDGAAAALHVDGVPIYESPGVPDAIAIAVDVDALAKIPPQVVARRLRGTDIQTVSSPVMVADPDGVAVVNIAQEEA